MGKKFGKIVYVVTAYVFDCEYMPLAAFETEEEAKRFIRNQDGNDYRINKLDLYPDFLSCSMDRYESRA